MWADHRSETAQENKWNTSMPSCRLPMLIYRPPCHLNTQISFGRSVGILWHWWVSAGITGPPALIAKDVPPTCVCVWEDQIQWEKGEYSTLEWAWLALTRRQGSTVCVRERVVHDSVCVFVLLCSVLATKVCPGGNEVFILLFLITNWVPRDIASG